MRSGESETRASNEAVRRVVEWCRIHAPKEARGFLPPAREEEIAAAEAATGVRWPEDLKGLFRVVNGQKNAKGQLFPLAPLYSLDEIVSVWQISLESRNQARIDALTSRLDASGGGYAVMIPVEDDDNAHELPPLLRHNDADAAELSRMSVETRRTLSSDHPSELSRSKFEIAAEPDNSLAGSMFQDVFVAEFIPFAGLDGYCYFVDTKPGPLSGCVGHWDNVDAYDAQPWPSLADMFDELHRSLATGATFGDYSRPSITKGRINWDFDVDD